MATRLEKFLSHGEIANSEPGKVTGTLWLIDSDEPILLELEGDCHRDLAGCILVFENPDPELNGLGLPTLEPYQKGIAGDITASRKVQAHLPDSIAGRPTLVNSLCVEWYSERGERFVIDTAGFCLYMGMPEWQMDAATEAAQLKENTKRFHDYIDTIANRLGDSPEDVEEIDAERPLNEFEWEERLKESDRITEAYMEALDKYQDLPNQENLVAAAMGWNQPTDSSPKWLSDDADEDDPDPYIDDDSDEDLDGDDAWIDGGDRDDDSHPLYERAHEFSVRLHREAQEMGILDQKEDANSDGYTSIQTLVFSSMELSAKLAGALNGLTSPVDPEPGLVVAWLKRGLPILGRALAAAGSTRAQSKSLKVWVDGARLELFGLRASMLDLIQEFRKQLP